MLVVSASPRARGHFGARAYSHSSPNPPRKRPDRTSVSVSAKTLARIDRYAAEHGFASRFEAVNHLIASALDRAAGTMS